MDKVLPKKKTTANATNSESDASEPPNLLKNNNGKMKFANLPVSCDRVDTKLFFIIKLFLIL